MNTSQCEINNQFKTNNSEKNILRDDSSSDDMSGGFYSDLENSTDTVED